MKMFLSQKAVALLTLLSVVKVDPADAVKCYSCSGSLGGIPYLTCNDPFDRDSFIAATQKIAGLDIGHTEEESAYCVKTKVQNGGESSIMRGASAVQPWSGCQSDEVGDAEAHVCYCSSNYCNGATPTHAAQGLLVAVFIGAVTILA